MPISVKKDIKPHFKLKGSSFSLRDMKGFGRGSVVNHVKEKIADENYKEFHDDWAIDMPKRNILISLAKKFNLTTKNREDVFKKLWDISRKSNAYKSDKVKEEIKKDLKRSYEKVARIANGERDDSLTFSRQVERDDDNFVIFSDHHFTNLKVMPNYFKTFNYQLYLKVLKQYATSQYCLVENGDVEECIIYDVSLTEAKRRSKMMRKFPIQNNDDWEEFLEARYAKRMETLETIIDGFPEYYALVKSKFIAKNKYVRLTGNHDTYSDEPFERDLKDKIEATLGMEVADVLTIKRRGKIDYVVLHGHQFDSVSQLHGKVPYAKSLGEVYSENISWAFQGPDRVWELKDSKKWFIGNEYVNKLAVETPGKYADDPLDPKSKGTKGQGSLVYREWYINKIKRDSKDFVETLLDHEIAWEYFENNSDASISGYLAMALEVLTGDEMFKFRHMSEVDLCLEYEKCYQSFAKNKGKTPPTLVLGHTHEPRQNSIRIEDNVMKPCPFYLNSGSAGRYENLIWCVEIRGGKDYIVSWSMEDDMLKKITWRSLKDKLTYRESDVQFINPNISINLNPIFG